MTNAKEVAQLLALQSAIASEGPYTQMIPMPRLKSKIKQRFATCPECGAERKTLYRDKGDWSCLNCLKGADHDHKTM